MNSPLSRLLAAAEPIKAALFSCTDGTEPDDTDIWEHPIGMEITYGQLRALSAARDDLRALAGEVETLRPLVVKANRTARGEDYDARDRQENVIITLLLGSTEG